MSSEEDMERYIDQLHKHAIWLRDLAQFGSREQLLAAGFLPETVEAVLAVREVKRES